MKIPSIRYIYGGVLKNNAKKNEGGIKEEPDP